VRREVGRGIGPGALLIVACLTPLVAGTASSVARPLAEGPTWKLAFDHYDERIGEGGAGIDVVTASSRVVSLVRRPRGSRDDYLFPRWSPDGRWLAFSARIADEDSLHVIRADGSRSRRVARGAIIDFDWSPDGRRLAFVAACDVYSPSDGLRGCGNGRIETVSRTGGRPTLVARPTAGRPRAMIHLHSWSPDGTRLLYGVTGPLRDRLYSIPTGGGTARVLADSRTEGRLGEAAWSSDGMLVAYKRRCREVRDVLCDLAVMTETGGSKTLLLASGHGSVGPSDTAPTWLPGTRLVVTSVWGNAARLVALDASTRTKTTLAPDPWWGVTASNDGRIVGGLDAEGLVLARPDGSVVARKRVPVEGWHVGYDLWLG
jgi:dipeptidyl aminopeptidase/acylaminoacyl peptidase